ncbi:MAG: hypothetical protein GEV28_39080 [Actinophytocola sp.]|uniref:hypothetical protein n=1 Tax=Actinophytocola sp. TaxID=1872138 RepID=UPI00132420F4|nr:hypothetical protein [Actinophytocola sp.]MPZ86055.1 hypothetical protein [Actinophytocola sp.]
MTADHPDLTTLRDDDQLLDQLGRGAPADGDVEEMLAGWRAGLPDAGPTDRHLLDAVTATVTGRRAARRRREHASRRRGAPNRRRTARVSSSAAAAVLIAGGTVTVAAAHAGPDSPLWPVTRAVYGDLAESRVARDGAIQAVSDARTEAGRGHYPEAERLLAVADSLVVKVHEPADARRLRLDIATVRDLLPKPQLPATSSANVPIKPPPPTPDGKDGKPDDTANDDNRAGTGDDDGDGDDRDRDDGNGKSHDDEKKVRPRALPSVPEVDPGELPIPTETEGR